MFRIMCKSKIHGAEVTEKKIEYEGSITIDDKILKEADILPGERVDVFDLTNGKRFTTYAISGEKNSGTICVNGAAARLVEIGDRLIIVSWALVSEEEATNFKKKVVFVGKGNKIKKREEK